MRMSDVEPKRVVARYAAEVLSGSRPESVVELVANPMLRERAATFRSAFPDVEVETHILLAEEDLVAVHLTGRGTHEGLFQGCPATGREWTATCTAIYRVRDGRIADVRDNWDWLAVMEQLGCVERAGTVSA